jgi:hypothetical protein
MHHLGWKKGEWMGWRWERERKIEVNENFVKLATCHARFIIGIRKDLDMESLREIYAKIHSAKFIIIHFLLLLLLIYSA